MNTARWLVLGGLFVGGCNGVPEDRNVTPPYMFEVESKPIGDPSADPYEEHAQPWFTFERQPEPEEAPEAQPSPGTEPQ